MPKASYQQMWKTCCIEDPPYCMSATSLDFACEPADLLQVHRLDEATGGLLLVAKTRLGLQGLSSSFEQRQVWAQPKLLPDLDGRK